MLHPYFDEATLFILIVAGTLVNIFLRCLLPRPPLTEAALHDVRHPIAEELSAGKDANGSEQFEGCYLLTADDARAVLRSGRDEAGNFYSVYTWIGLASFTAGLWKE